MSLAAKLKRLRGERRESLQQVADALGISKTHVYDLERGASKNPTVELLTAISDHFKVPIAELVGENTEDRDVDQNLVRMFRQASELGDLEKKILDDMIKSLRERQSERNDQH